MIFFLPIEEIKSLLTVHGHGTYVRNNVGTLIGRIESIGRCAFNRPRLAAESYLKNVKTWPRADKSPRRALYLQDRKFSVAPTGKGGRGQNFDTRHSNYKQFKPCAYVTLQPTNSGRYFCLS